MNFFINAFAGHSKIVSPAYDISTKGVVTNTPRICNIFLFPIINSVCAVCITQSCKPDDEFVFLLHPYCWHHTRPPVPQNNYLKRRHCKLLFLHTIMIKYNSELYIVTSYASILH